MSALFSNSSFGTPDNLPPYSDSVIPRTVPMVTVLLFLALVAYILRMYTRVVHYRSLGPDDYCMTLAMVSEFLYVFAKPKLTLV
jgi:hypothetical protein